MKIYLYFLWMLLIFYGVMLSAFISAVIMLIGLLLSINIFEDREKRSPFECGFDPKSSARIPFSTRFFLLAVIFLVFDIEIALIIPLPIVISNNILYEVILGGLIFLLILVVGLLHEWKEGSLDWKE